MLVLDSGAVSRLAERSRQAAALTCARSWECSCSTPTAFTTRANLSAQVHGTARTWPAYLDPRAERIRDGVTQLLPWLHATRGGVRDRAVGGTRRPAATAPPPAAQSHA